jgi:CBS domain containing-hemolysin-like protein
VFDPARNDLVGVINIKTLALLSEGEVARIVEGDVIKDLLRVPADRRIDGVLAQMRRGRQHMAAVVDRGGSAIGILTMEDIIEEIFGEIEDEFDVGARPAGDGRPGTPSRPAG